MHTSPFFHIIQLKMSKPSIAINSSTIDPNDFKFGTEGKMPCEKSYQNFGTIAINLHNSGFDDVICKALIESILHEKKRGRDTFLLVKLERVL